MAKAQAQKKQQGDFLAKVSKLTKGAKAGILLSSLAAVIGAFYMLYYTPWQQEIVNLENDVNNLNQDLNNTQANLSKLGNANKVMQPIDYAYEYYSNFLTEENDIEGLLNIIADSGAQSNISTTNPSYNFRSSMSLTPLYAEIKFTIDLEAPFLNIVNFLYTISNNQRIINMTSVTMNFSSISNTRQILLKVRCQGSVYRQLTSDEIKLASAS
jgi:Tfp pilus assembly protein PilO